MVLSSWKSILLASVLACGNVWFLDAMGDLEGRQTTSMEHSDVLEDDGAPELSEVHDASRQTIDEHEIPAAYAHLEKELHDLMSGVPGKEFDIRSFMKTLQNAMKLERDKALQLEISRRKKMFDQLPPAVCQAIEEAERLYGAMVQHLNLSAVIHGLLGKIISDIDHFELNVPTETLLLIDECLIALENRSFDQLLFGGVSHDALAGDVAHLDRCDDHTNECDAGMDVDLSSLQSLYGYQEAYAFTDEKLRALVDGLALSVKNVESSDARHQVDLVSWKRGVKILQSVADKKLYLAAYDAFDALQELLGRARHALVQALDLLQPLCEEELQVHKKTVATSSVSQQDQINHRSRHQVSPAYHFYQQLDGYRRTLTVLMYATVGGARDSLELSEGLLKFVTFGNSLLAPFLDLGRIDKDNGAIAESARLFMINDRVIQPAIIIWRLFNMRSTILAEMVKVHMTKGLQGNYDYIHLLALNAAVIPATFVVPYVMGAPKSTMELIAGRIGVAWLYYHFVHCYYFQKAPSCLSDFGCTKDFPFIERVSHSGGLWWDPQYPHLVDAIRYAITEVRRLCGDYMQMQLIRSVAPETLDVAEEYSAGLMRPELIGLALRLGTPAFERGSIAGYGLEHIAAVRHLGDPDKPLGDLYDWGWFSYWYAEELMNKSISPEAYYIEAQFYCYMLESLGGYCGQKIAATYHEHVYEYFVASIRALIHASQAMDCMSQEAAGELIQGLESHTAHGKQEIMALLKQIFVEPPADSNLQAFRPLRQPTLRQGMIQMLLMTKQVSLDEAHDALLVNSKIISTASRMLTLVGLLKYSQAAELINMFKHGPEDIDALLHYLVDTMAINIAGKIGNKVGSWSAQAVGMQVMRAYGPFFSKNNGSSPSPRNQLCVRR